MASSSGSGSRRRPSSPPLMTITPAALPPPPPPAVDPPRFINPQAELQYTTRIRGRPILYEHSVDLSQDSVRHIVDVIHQRGWGFLLDEPLTPNLSIVREFYANFEGVGLQEVYVRGRPVPVTMEAIRAVTSIPETPEMALPDDHQQLLDRIRTVDVDTLKDAITTPGSVWTRNRYGHPHTLDSQWLTFPARIWMRLLFSHIIPCSHVHSITMDQVFMLYCVATEQRVYLPRLIRLTMQAVHHDKRVNGLPFPSLITRMALTAGVPVWPTDEQPPPNRRPTLISGPTLQRVDTAARNRARGVPVPPPRPRPGPGPSADFSSAIADLQRALTDQIRRSERRMRAQVRASEARVMTRLRRLELRVQGVDPQSESDTDLPLADSGDDSRDEDPDVEFSELEVDSEEDD